MRNHRKDFKGYMMPSSTRRIRELFGNMTEDTIQHTHTQMRTATGKLPRAARQARHCSRANTYHMRIMRIRHSTCMMVNASMIVNKDVYDNDDRIRGAVNMPVPYRLAEMPSSPRHRAPLGVKGRIQCSASQ